MKIIVLKIIFIVYYSILEYYIIKIMEINNKSTFQIQNKKCNSAYLELIIGPMCSGKTSKLIEIAKQCKICDISYMVVNHSFDDKRFGNSNSNNQLSSDSLMYTHDKKSIKCIYSSNLENIIDDLLNFDVILINEGQFFTDLCETVKKMLIMNKQIYIAGLDGDFERKRFGQIIDLIPLCDKVNKLSSLCGICKDGTSGIFSMRVTEEKEQTVVGSDNYIPVCRKCFLNNKNNE